MVNATLYARQFQFLALIFFISGVFPVQAYAQNEAHDIANIGVNSPPMMDFNRAMKSLEMQNYIEEIKRDKSDENSKYIWYQEGVQYYRGNGVNLDYQRAYELWKQAAEQGLPEASHAIGILFLKGRGFQANLTEAASWFEKAAEKDYLPSINQLAVMYYNGGEEFPKDRSKAFEFYKQGASLHDAQCLFGLGALYFAGDGVAQNKEAAFHAWRESAQRGNVEAQYNIATLYESGIGVNKDMDSALSWYKKAARNGHKGAVAALRDLTQTSASGGN